MPRLLLQFFLGEPQAAGAERIGDDSVAACVVIRLMYACYDLGMAEIPRFRPFPGLQAFLLQKAAHAAVQDQDIVFQIV